MAVRNSVHRRYMIPENMADGSKFMGFPIRNLVEAGVMGGIVILLCFGMLPVSEFSTKFSITVILAAPFLCFGAVGFNGYPVSYFLKVVMCWFKNRGIILYDSSIRLLETSLLDNQMEQVDLRDKIIDLYHAHVANSRAKAADQVLIEGVNFKFAQDKEELSVTAARKKAEDELSADAVGEEDVILLPEAESTDSTLETTEDVSEGFLVADEDTVEATMELVLPTENTAEAPQPTSPEAQPEVQDADQEETGEGEPDNAGPDEESPSKDDVVKATPPAPKNQRQQKKSRNKKKGARSGHGKK